jgi:hypothetical protein
LTQIPENENDIETADSLMERLEAEAKRRGDPRRLVTLSRLVQACNDLQSGAAYRQAKAARETFAEIYDPRYLNLRSKLVSHYVDYRRRIEGPSSEWTGPHDVTIRRHPEWMTYLRLRRDEAGSSKKKRRTEGSKRLDDMIDHIPDVFERDQIRAAVERGRKSRNDLNILIEACRKLPEIDIDLLREGKHPKRHVEEPLPRAVALSADWIVDVNAPTDDHFRAACKLFMDKLPTDEEVVLLRSSNPADLEVTMRRGRRLAQCLTRLNDDRRLRAATPISNKAMIKLSDLFGYGPAAAWGRQLAADLFQWKGGSLGWDDVDRGLLLSGPPGTGKTTYARALANECNAHLEIASLARWQAKGHLGDLLKAMRNSFANARRNAPSILFIDEIDSIGDRDAFAGQNAQYCTEVVNALLECLCQANPGIDPFAELRN